MPLTFNLLFENKSHKKKTGYLSFALGGFEIAVALVPLVACPVIVDVSKFAS